MKINYPSTFFKIFSLVVYFGLFGLFILLYPSKFAFMMHYHKLRFFLFLLFVPVGYMTCLKVLDQIVQNYRTKLIKEDLT